MGKKYYTIQEIQTMRVYELPNIIYNAIFRDLMELFGIITAKMREILDNARVLDLDQYGCIYNHIAII